MEVPSLIANSNTSAREAFLFIIKSSRGHNQSFSDDARRSICHWGMESLYHFLEVFFSISTFHALRKIANTSALVIVSLGLNLVLLLEISHSSAASSTARQTQLLKPLYATSVKYPWQKKSSDNVVPLTFKAIHTTSARVMVSSSRYLEVLVCLTMIHRSARVFALFKSSMLDAKVIQEYKRQNTKYKIMEVFFIEK